MSTLQPTKENVLFSEIITSHISDPKIFFPPLATESLKYLLSQNKVFLLVSKWAPWAGDLLSPSASPELSLLMEHWKHDRMVPTETSERYERKE